MASQRKAGALLGYANILAKNLVNLVYTPMLLSYVGQADYGVFQSSNSFVFSLTLLSFGFSEAYVRFYTQTVAHGGERDIRHLNGMYLTLYVAVTAAAVALGMGFSANAGAVFSAGFTEAQVSLARELLAIMTLNVASTLFTVVFNSYITAHERFVYQQTRQLVTTLATPLCAWALLAAGMGPVGRYQMVLFCWVYGGFAILGKFFVTRWAGPGFAEAYWLVLAMTLPVMVPLCQNVGIEIQRAKNMHHARSLVYLAMAVGNVAFTAAAAPALGPWAPAIAYVVSIVLGNGLWMNWYYQKRVGLDMLFFWKRNLPVLLAWAAVTVACLAGTAVLPVNGWPAFLEWGAVYSALFAIALWLAVLTKDERIAVVSRLPFLR